MVKYFCDRCEKEITDAERQNVMTNYIIKKVTISPVPFETSVALCAGCYKELERFVEGEKRRC